jgi:hypothetical protein
MTGPAHSAACFAYQDGHSARTNLLLARPEIGPALILHNARHVFFDRADERLQRLPMLSHQTSDQETLR